MDPDPALDTDATSFFVDFKYAKQTHHLQSKKYKFFLKFCGKILFCRHYFSPLNTSMRKGKVPQPDPDPQHCSKVYQLGL
jgi:hypothetical protein